MSNSLFELRKVKCNDKSYLFVNTDLPALIYINKESLNISNFNVKDCGAMINLNSNLFAFLFNESIIIGGLSNSESQNVVTKAIGKKIYNLTQLSGSTNFICYLEEEKKDDGWTRFSFVVIDKHLNEISRYKFENEKEVCMTFHVIDDQNLLDNLPKCQKLFILGTGVIHNPIEEPIQGHLMLLSMDQNYNLQKIREYETPGGVYKITGNKNLIYVAISSTLYVHSIECLPNKGLDLKLLRKSCDFTIINDLYCRDDVVLVSDVCKSVTLFKFEEEKEKLVEVCRDFNPIWSYALTPIEKNIFMISDIDGNIYSLRMEVNPRCDEEKFKFERVSQFNLGERINKLVTIEKNINLKDWDLIFKYSDEKSNNVQQEKNKIKLTYFGTLEGSLGLFASLPKDTFEFLYLLQNEILKVISSTGNFDYEKWRAFKVKKFNVLGWFCIGFFKRIRRWINLAGVFKLRQ